MGFLNHGFDAHLVRWAFLPLVLAGCARLGPGGDPAPLTATAAVAAADPEKPTDPAGASPGPLSTTESGVIVPEAVPPLDTSLRSVPLDQIYFDTFRPVNRAVPLSQASEELIESLLDAIPPLQSPKYETASEATWLSKDDLILGYASPGGAWAYPIRILNYHEIVNDVLGGQPVLISYCPLCYSGIVYSRALLGDRILTFGNTSALYESDLVMVDYETGSYWWQVAGQAIVGPLTGRALITLPSMMTSWEIWADLHPDTLVLARDTGFARDYERDPFTGFTDYLNNGRYAFPVSNAVEDDRLPPGAKVLAVRVGEAVRVYPLEGPGRAAWMDDVGGSRVAVFYDPAGPTAAAFEPAVAGQRLTFFMEGDQILDQETNSSWDLAGAALSGPQAGNRLPALPAKTTFWYAIVAAESEITIYRP